MGWSGLGWDGWEEWEVVGSVVWWLNKKNTVIQIFESDHTTENYWWVRVCGIATVYYDVQVNFGKIFVFAKFTMQKLAKVSFFNFVGKYTLRYVGNIRLSFPALTREILFLPLEHKIPIFSPPCNILYKLLYIWHKPRCYQGKKCFRKPNLHVTPSHCFWYNTVRVLISKSLYQTSRLEGLLRWFTIDVRVTLRQ